MSGASGKVSGQGAGDRIRQPVSIEQLLVWAYAEQMVHEARRSRDTPRKGNGPLAPYATLWFEHATPVEGSADMGFIASDDAWLVDDQVKRLGSVTVDCGQDLAATRYHSLGQFRGFDPPLGKPGTVDQVARSWPTNGVLEIDVCSLVMIHASRDTQPERPARPDWRLKPVHKGMVRHPSSKGGVYQRGWFHHLELDGLSPGEVREMWAIYRAWWDGLDTVRRKLDGAKLTMFALTDVMPPKPRGLD